MIRNSEVYGESVGREITVESSAEKFRRRLDRNLYESTKTYWKVLAEMNRKKESAERDKKIKETRLKSGKPLIEKKTTRKSNWIQRVSINCIYDFNIGVRIFDGSVEKYTRITPFSIEALAEIENKNFRDQFYRLAGTRKRGEELPSEGEMIIKALEDELKPLDLCKKNEYGIYVLTRKGENLVYKASQKEVKMEYHG